MKAYKDTIKFSKKEFEKRWIEFDAEKIGNMWIYDNRPFFYVHEAVENTLEDYEHADNRLERFRLESIL